MGGFTRLRMIWEPRMLSILRIMTGLLFLEHGTAKILDFPHQPTHVAWALNSVNPGLQGLIELVGGFLIAVGLFTRPVAFLLAGDMAVAYFWRLAPRSIFPILSGGGDAAILYCFVFLYFFIVGAGVWSLDQLRVGEVAAPLPAGSRP